MLETIMPNFLGVMLRHCVGRGDTQTAAQFAEGVVEVEVEVGWVVLSSRQVELERGALTAKPAVAAQVLSPAALIMAALSMWPVPTRLYKSRNVQQIMVPFFSQFPCRRSKGFPRATSIHRTLSQHMLEAER